MILFTSLLSVQLSTAAVIALLLWLGTGRQPLDPLYRLARVLVTSRKHLLFFAASAAILIVNTNEVRLESRFGVTYDLTAALTGWEGTWQATLQDALRSDYLTALCVFFYVAVFQSVLLASLGIYADERFRKLFFAFCIALLVNYAAAVPMYWFLPVNEAWYAKPDIGFLMLDAFPTFERDYRGLSGINNCFPSLHTSISITLALLASRSGIRRWMIFAWIHAAVIVFSIFYLGIHWFTDMAAGAVLAVISVSVGMTAAERVARPVPKPNPSSHEKKAFPTG